VNDETEAPIDALEGTDDPEDEALGDAGRSGIGT
jgi:hypothetical protein